jgi:hypothetical protein
MLVDRMKSGNREASHRNCSGHDKESFMDNDAKTNAYPDEERDPSRIDLSFRFSERFHSSFLFEEA